MFSARAGLWVVLLAWLITPAPAGDAIPEARAASGMGIRAELAGPTTVYAHCALGDCIEAARIDIFGRAGGAAQSVPAGPGAVFEDLEPMIADLDGDGSPEILVIRATATGGASLAVIARRGEAWAIVAQTPPIGTPHRWLNRAAVGDFFGEGRRDIAIVVTPHLRGIVQIWRYDAVRGLTKLAERAGYSNHAYGAVSLDLAAAIPLEGAKGEDLIIPTLDRRHLAVLVGRRQAGAYRLDEVRRHALPNAAIGGLRVENTGKGWTIRLRLTDGSISEVGL